MKYISLPLLILSGVLSWIVNQSIWWCILHVFLTAVYIPYWIIKYTGLIDWIKGFIV